MFVIRYERETLEAVVPKTKEVVWEELPEETTYEQALSKVGKDYPPESNARLFEEA